MGTTTRRAFSHHPSWNFELLDVELSIAFIDTVGKNNYEITMRINKTYMISRWNVGFVVTLETLAEKLFFLFETMTRRRL